MPIAKYFKGHGQDVMRDMENDYGPKKARRVFYATANARGETPSSSTGAGGKIARLKKIRKVKRLGTIRTGS